MQPEGYELTAFSEHLKLARRFDRPDRRGTPIKPCFSVWSPDSDERRFAEVLYDEAVEGGGFIWIILVGINQKAIADHLISVTERAAGEANAVATVTAGMSFDESRIGRCDAGHFPFRKAGDLRAGQNSNGVKSVRGYWLGKLLPPRE
jgi:hypothetical protein